MYHVSRSTAEEVILSEFHKLRTLCNSLFTDFATNYSDSKSENFSSTSSLSFALKKKWISDIKFLIQTCMIYSLTSNGRQSLYKLLLGLSNKKKNKLYNNEVSNTVISQIEADVRRTPWDGGSAEKESEHLTKSLIEFVKAHTDDGYCQGLNLISATLIRVFLAREKPNHNYMNEIEYSKRDDNIIDNEEANQLLFHVHVADCLSKILYDVGGLQDCNYYKSDLQGSIEDINLMWGIIKKIDWQLYRHIQDICVNECAFNSKEHYFKRQSMRHHIFSRKRTLSLLGRSYEHRTTEENKNITEDKILVESIRNQIMFLPFLSLFQDGLSWRPGSPSAIHIMDSVIIIGRAIDNFRIVLIIFACCILIMEREKLLNVTGLTEIYEIIRDKKNTRLTCCSILNFISSNDITDNYILGKDQHSKIKDRMWAEIFNLYYEKNKNEKKKNIININETN